MATVTIANLGLWIAIITCFTFLSRPEPEAKNHEPGEAALDTRRESLLTEQREALADRRKKLSMLEKSLAWKHRSFATTARRTSTEADSSVFSGSWRRS